MIPFICLIFIPMIIQHTKVRGFKYDKKNKFALLIFFCILLILLMCRDESIGNDTRNYISIFKNISGQQLSSINEFSDEFGFVIFTKFVSEITANPQIYIAITALIVVLLIAPTYLSLIDDTSLTIALFCSLSTFVMMFSGIRQMLAIGIGFIAYRFVKQRKPLPFILTVLVAISFHNSAVLLFVMYPLYHAKITRKWLLAIVPIMTACFIFNRQIFTFLAVFLNEYTRFDAFIDSNGSYMMIIVFSVLGIFAYLIPDEKKVDEEIIGLRNFLLFAILIQLFAPLHALAMRMNYYFIIFIPLLIPKIISNRSNKWQQVAVISRHIMVVLFLAYFFYTAITARPLHVFPYQFFWESA